ncbi:MAG TPA: hypothetical protein VFX85_09985, partial [Solirubrobacterales bacterium]|nr:hypothetical protein [Solirubrobacterales bacterium]
MLLAIVATAAVIALAAGAAGAPACSITGTPGPDLIRGTAKADVICGGGGPDKVFGRGGADVLKGGPGEDVLAGGAGNDRLLGGPGLDRLRGGPGSDRCQDRTAFSSSCGENLRKPGLPPRTGFPCCSLPPDREAPEVIDVVFTSPYVDTSSESSVELWVDGRDAGSGLGLVEAELEGPDGPWRKLSFEGSSSYGAGAYARVEVPAWTPRGKYRLTGLSVSDRAGNRVAFDEPGLRRAGLDAEFDVFFGPDVEGPELTGFSFSPPTLDTGSAPGSVLFSLGATDDLSGVADAAALVLKPGEVSLCFPCGHRARSNLSAGTIYDGAWSEVLPLPRFARGGTYEVNALVLYDRAGNETFYDRAELEGLGYPLDFTQTDPGDSTPPQILNFWMSTRVLRSSGDDKAIDFFVHAKDDLSGVGESDDSVFERMHVSIHPPHASEWGLGDGGVTQISGDQLDGLWRFRYFLPADAETGTWRVDAVSATDRAGNETLLHKGTLAATGWDLTFENLP